MKARTLEEIEQAFREIGLTEPTWGRMHDFRSDLVHRPPQSEYFLLRTDNMTIPLEMIDDAHLA